MVLSYRLESAGRTIGCFNNRQNSASRECLVSIYRLNHRLVQFAVLTIGKIQRETINIKIVKNRDCRLPCPEKFVKVEVKVQVKTDMKQSID